MWSFKKKKQMPELETERLVLRGFKKTDAADFYFYAKDPDVGPHAGWSPHRNVQESKSIIDGFIDRGLNWAVVEKSSNRVIGSVSATIDNKRVVDKGYWEIGYALGKPWWGKGYATEACKRLMEHFIVTEKAKLLSIAHYPDNTRSKKVIEKCGFKYEGTFRDSVKRYNGKIESSCYYSITPEEFNQL